ncbi:MAG: hypothetical protein P1P88_21205 [Bacteroidales bacterium]|nr:hypothetical protein [Bacteroidales bacterium]
MKAKVFLFVAIVLTCFVGISQANAQAEVTKGDGYFYVDYELDGETIWAIVELDYLTVITPSGNGLEVYHGVIVGYWDPDYGNIWGEMPPISNSAIVSEGVSDIWKWKQVITPNGHVTITYKAKKQL